MIIRHTKPFVTYIGDVMLYPGNNEVSEEVAKKLLAEPAFQERVSCGLFQVIDTSAKAVTTPPAPAKAAVKIATATKVSISTMTLPNAIKVIQGTVVRSELERMAQTDMRKGVQDAIKKQIATVSANDEVEED